MSTRSVRVRISRRRAGLVLLALSLAACRTAPGEPPVGAHYDPETGRLRMLTYDSTGDGIIDTWTFMDGTRVLRIEIDSNQDGVIDRWEYYDEANRLEKVGFSRAGDGVVDAWAYAGPDGGMERIEIALMRDEVVTRWEHYRDGILVLVEEDTTLGGRPDKWEHYEGDRLSAVAFDETGDGRPDRRLNYAEGGRLVSIETEPDDRGVFRRRLELGAP